MQKLNILYKRILDKNYMILENCDFEKEDYELKMIIINKIKGLLVVDMINTDNNITLNYNISSKQSLKRVLEYKKLSYFDIKRLVNNMVYTLENLSKYLLKDTSVVLNVDYIYVDINTYDIEFMYIPEYENDISKDFSCIFSSILNSVDNEDNKAVILSYTLYQNSLKQYFDYHNLLTIKEELENGYINTDNNKIIHTKNTINKTNVDDVIDCLSDFTDEEEKVLAKTEEKSEKFSFKSLFSNKSKTEFIKEDTKETENQIAKEDNYLKEYLQVDNNYKTNENIMPNDISKANEEDIYEHTVLLSEYNTGKSKYILKAVDKSVEDIDIKYFPFIIGRATKLCDYILDKDGVSRLHFKIEKSGDGLFIITDLNSRNGLYVNGKLLENEEYFVLNIGDEIEVAKIKYIFFKLNN